MRTFQQVSLASLALIASRAMGRLPETYKYGTSIVVFYMKLYLRFLHQAPGYSSRFEMQSEPWMNPVEWARMGGEYCPVDSASCAASEWSLARKLGQTAANDAFLKHWQTWFTQDHVDQLKALKLDHVRIPLGFVSGSSDLNKYIKKLMRDSFGKWIVEELVEAPAELYAQGGWMELRRGLRQLQDAGFHVTLDMHALPGVSTPNQMFAGKRCGHRVPQRAPHRCKFLSSLGFLYNWTIEWQYSHPHLQASLTPGLEQYYSDFVTITRVIEFAIGVKCEADLRKSIQRLSQSKNAMAALRAAIPLIVTYAGKAKVGIDPKVLGILKGSLSNPSPVATAPAPVVTATITSRNSFPVIPRRSVSRSCLATMAMPKRWQWKGNSNSMANYTLGPAAYGDHMYFAYGGVAGPNITSYVTTVCALPYYEQAKEVGEVPYGHSEFSLATNFNATNDDLRAWGDAQRWTYNKEHFWTFWNFRLGQVSEPKLAQRTVETWSYLGAVEAGLWPRDPSQYFNPSICAPQSGPHLNSTRSSAKAVLPGALLN
ncbi:hypothetical protein PSTT_13643 [Puccinia striiformis]|uniref:Glycoside hydrolase family 5 domain-containing protein n=1 Tax=Puccinia striiformis TaxID=27350 RepID=A0A2S4UR26_9BASI|nr:hypothetical protein PSTT_13643 [Puccinia striiformis]